MNKSISLVLSASIFLSGCATNIGSNNLSSSENNKEMLVFVHGAHLSGNAWSSVAGILEKDRYRTMMVNLPGREASAKPNDITLDASSQALCDSIKSVKAPIHFIAHSQGGAVVNNALSICPVENIKTIIYVAAVVPVKGDKPFSKLNALDEENYFKAIHFDEETAWMVINDEASFVSVFTNSRSDEIKKLIFSQAVNEPAMIGEGVVSYDEEVFSEISKFYIYTKQDKIISLESQKAITANLNIKNHAVIDTGHLPMVSEPKMLSSKIKLFLP